MAGLVKKLDAEVAKAGKGKICAAVVFLSDDDGMKEKIEEFKKTNEIKNVSLALDSSKGPEAYKIEKKADVTAILYKSRKVLANHAFESFTANDVEKVTADLPKLTN